MHIQQLYVSYESKCIERILALESCYKGFESRKMMAQDNAVTEKRTAIYAHGIHLSYLIGSLFNLSCAVGIRNTDMAVSTLFIIIIITSVS